MAAESVTVHPIVVGALETNCYVVAAPSADAVVVDPGDDADAIADHVAARGLRPQAVLATHGHHDHVGGAAQLSERYGIPFGIHPAESANLLRLNFCRRVFHDQGPVPIPEIGIDLETTARLRFGALEMTIVHTPGHSPGGVCLALEGVLLTGDTLLATHLGSTNMPGADAASLEASVRRVGAAYPPGIALHPGHGEPGTLGDALDRGGLLS